MPEPLPLRTDFVLRRSSPFSYRCHACSRCCHHKAIPVNPHEIAKLAEHLGISTTDFLAMYTAHAGATLRADTSDGRCVFLGAGGCGVHPARPLACRLYPLARYVSAHGEERFAEVVPHPETEGEYGTQGSVADYLRQQNAEPWMAASDRYFAVLGRLLEALFDRPDHADAAIEAQAALDKPPAVDEENLLDVDRMVTQYCSERGLSVPTNAEERVRIHLTVLEEIAGT